MSNLPLADADPEVKVELRKFGKTDIPTAHNA